ncbi:MAG: hypothetical protein IJU19_04295 [Bacteroidales bacterium]|nr:hypothetical protein [Bacteroidales bacterium]
MKKRLSIVMALVACAATAGAQRLVQTTDGACYWTLSSLEADSLLTVGFEGMASVYVPTSRVAAVEDMAGETVVLHPEALMAAPPKAFPNGATDLIGSEGLRVYVPMGKRGVQQAWGGRRLTELIIRDDYWRLVATRDQADLILEYNYIEEGGARAYLTFQGRTGERFLYSRSVPAKELTATASGIKSAERLYDEFVRGLVMRSDSEPWASGDDTTYMMLPPQKGFILTGSFAAGVTDDITFGFSPKVECGYTVTPYLVLGVGVGYLSQAARWEPMGTIASEAGAYYPYSFSLGGPSAVAIATLPITLGARYLLNSDLYVEAAAGYALPLQSRHYSHRDQSLDAYGDLVYADQELTVRPSAFFGSLGFGYRKGNFDLGLTLQVQPAAKVGTSEVELKVVDIFEQQHQIGQTAYDNKATLLFFGLKVAYNLSLIQQ